MTRTFSCYPDPNVAYRYAKGEPVVHPSLSPPSEFRFLAQFNEVLILNFETF